MRRVSIFVLLGVLLATAAWWFLLIGPRKRNGVSACSGSPSTSGTMHIIFRRVRKVVIQNKFDITNINTTGGNIGSD